jgi:hypothetical protein
MLCKETPLYSTPVCIFWLINIHIYAFFFVQISNSSMNFRNNCNQYAVLWRYTHHQWTSYYLRSSPSDHGNCHYYAYFDFLITLHKPFIAKVCSQSCSNNLHIGNANVMTSGNDGDIPSNGTLDCVVQLLSFMWLMN